MLWCRLLFFMAMLGKGIQNRLHEWNKELKNINLDHCLIHCINRTAPHLNKSEGAMKAIAHLLGCCKYQQDIPGGFTNTSITKSSEQCLEVSCWKLCSSQAKLQHFFHWDHDKERPTPGESWMFEGFLSMLNEDLVYLYGNYSIYTAL